MISKIMHVCNNYFYVKGAQVSDTFTISKGAITLPFLTKGQYYKIVGSLFNDGVYCYGDGENLTDEEFDGTVYPLAPPKEFIDLCKSIKAYEDSDASTITPYKSESFGGYSYTKADGASGAGITWQEAFKVHLRQWRRI